MKPWTFVEVIIPVSLFTLIPNSTASLQNALPTLRTIGCLAKVV